MNDEWRVEVNLDDEQGGYTLGERLRSLSLDEEAEKRLGGRAIVTKDGPKLFVYTDSEQAVREAERIVTEVLAEHELTAQVGVSRYHPVEGAWKDPSIPLPADEDAERAEYERKLAEGMREAAASGEFPWEVRVDFRHLEDAVAAERKLADEDLFVHRRWRHLLIGQATDGAAGALAERLRSEIPEAESISIEAHDVRYPVFMLLGSAT